MKTYSRIIGALSLCLLFQQMQAAETPPDDTNQYQLVAKGSGSKSESEFKLNPGGKGPPGCAGPRGRCCTPAYALAYQVDPVDKGALIAGDPVTIPLDTLARSEGITFDGPTDTLTLPKGVYSMHFQSMHDENSHLLDPVYLDIGGVPLNLAWISTIHDPDNKYTTYSGSTIFEVPANNTPVKLCTQVKSVEGSGRKLIFKDPNTALNYPVRVVFQKIDDLS